jgi:PTH1 family peptidyl-tRNA hydrolase
MWLIVGLGNPGAQYELTRHNIGFLAIDFLLNTKNISTTKKAFQAEYARLDSENDSVLFLKPQTFMNRSGKSVLAAASFHKIPADQIIVIHDDLDLALGEIRIKKGGGHGGHNGLRDITNLMGPDFIRIRLGIGRPSHKGDEANYVLANFSQLEISNVEEIFKKIPLAVKTIINDGLEKAQAQCQSRR